MIELLTESLPPIRVTPTTRKRMEEYAGQHPLTRTISDHIRLAVEEYLDRRDVPDPIVNASTGAVQEPAG